MNGDNFLVMGRCAMCNRGTVYWNTIETVFNCSYDDCLLNLVPVTRRPHTVSYMLRVTGTQLMDKVRRMLRTREEQQPTYGHDQGV